jgi:hypothetical protein
MFIRRVLLLFACALAFSIFAGCEKSKDLNIEKTDADKDTVSSGVTGMVYKRTIEDAIAANCKVITFKIDSATGLLITAGIQTSVSSPVCLKFLKVHQVHVTTGIHNVTL